jgi:hypothetical protein
MKLTPLCLSSSTFYFTGSVLLLNKTIITLFASAVNAFWQYLLTIFGAPTQNRTANYGLQNRRYTI